MGATEHRSRLAQAVRGFWPAGASGYVLAGLLVAGVALRLVAIISWWPTASTLDDGYQAFADNSQFGNPLHPAGYTLILSGLGTVTREIAVPVLLQHVSGFVSALLLFAATRRVTGSAWAGLAPAAVVLLNPDQIFLEHAIMSESWIVLFSAVGLYAAVRGFDVSRRWWPWPLVAGSALAIAVTIRTGGLLLIAVAALALLLCRPGPLRDWTRWRPAVIATAAAAVVLLAFATANARFGYGFELAPSSGWYLYGRAAQFADCDRFEPPPGTEVLCDERPPGDRPGGAFYMFNEDSPAQRYFGDPTLPYGGFGENEEAVGTWARRAVRAQPLDYLSAVWEYGRAYWIPGLKPEPASTGGELSPQLDFTRGLDQSFNAAIIEGIIKQNLELFFDPFTVDKDRPGLRFLDGLHNLTRFGGVLLTLTTLLTLVGLFVGSRRLRAGVLLFGIGGLSLLVAPALTANYYGRYTVPMAGLMMAAAAIAIVALWRRFGRPAAAPGDLAAAPEPVAQS